MGDGGRGNQSRPDNKFALIVFTALASVGLGILIWLSVEDPSKRDTLAEAADWLFKGAVGAIFATVVTSR